MKGWVSAFPSPVPSLKRTGGRFGPKGTRAGAPPSISPFLWPSKRKLRERTDSIQPRVIGFGPELAGTEHSFARKGNLLCTKGHLHIRPISSKDIYVFRRQCKS